MSVHSFRELLKKEPFQPFRLVMSSGQSYQVRRPEMAMLTRTDILVGLDETDEGVPAHFKDPQNARTTSHSSELSARLQESPCGAWSNPG